ncbi:hypothetical protein D4740_03340 [Actinomyces sp. 2119]|uniref:Serine/arginine repetitive matrix protein 2 n=1 Tax=Actinomyces lilanjuaniae TaxID=2321394 RepID=A0ABN5PQ77_9ACTO|nr:MULTISPECIES: hypothetical protein [Actinomyces]AYD90563.1 hypothetical protein D5R93_12160 [Actinomyces lilanjuaniae]RJF43985.1 hypothetical protein D4740_03340 [Actinomyces sp. 2119]
MSSFETDDGQPRYGRRVSPDELAAVLAEQGIEPAGTAPDPAGGEQATHTLPAAVQASSGWVSPPGGVSLERWTSRSDSRRSERSVRRSAGRGRWRTVAVGLVLMLVVPLVLVAGAFRLAVDWSGAETTVLGTSGAVYLQEGTQAMVYSGSQEQTTECTVTGPDGAAVSKSVPEQGIPYARFTASTSGTYTVRCEGGTEGMLVGPPLRTDRLVMAGAMLLGALLCGVTGLAVTVLGLSRGVRQRA